MNKRTRLLKQLASEAIGEKISLINQKAVKDIGDINLAIEPGPTTIQAIQTKFTDPIEKNMPDRKVALLQMQLTHAARTLNISDEHLQAWLDGFTNIPQPIKLSLLRLISRTGLDPFLEEIVFTQYEPNQWETLITLNGWSTLANRSTTISGIVFTTGPVDEHTIPLWMECSIYRHDRVLPTTVREYYAEVMSQSETWKKMPRRMLRHKVFSQCARLAFGL